MEGNGMEGNGNTNPHSPPSGNGNGWDLKTEDLKDAGRLVTWMRHTKILPDSHENEIKVIAASERALSDVKIRGNPPTDRVAYFVSIVRQGNWKVITDDDRDRAKRRHSTWSRTAATTSAAPDCLKSPEDHSRKELPCFKS